MTQNYQYIDGIDQIVLVDGVVRFDLVTLTKGETSQPAPVRAGGMALSVAAFLRTHEQMGKVVSSMMNQGVITRKDTEIVPPALNSRAGPKGRNKS